MTDTAVQTSAAAPPVPPLPPVAVGTATPPPEPDGSTWTITGCTTATATLIGFREVRYLRGSQ